jgi:hypothetical protein
MGVHIAPPFGLFLVKVGDAVDDRHRKRPRFSGVPAGFGQSSK